MSLFRKFFYRKPPDGLLEISERVFVFDCCFMTDVLEDDEYKFYMGGIASQLRDHFQDSSFMVFNFRDGEHQSLLTEILSEYDMTVMDYPKQYEGCPLLTMEMIHHFLRSSESWLSLSQQNILLMHCEWGGWPVLAFMLAGLLIYRKQYTSEQKTLDMIYKQAPRELLQFLSPLNPLPSQMRYLQYISRRNVGSIWPPLDRVLTLDCVILRFIPNFDGEGGCRPLFRIYGQDPFTAADQAPKVLFSTPKRSKALRIYRQADCELVKIDIHCHIQGDVVLECINLDDDLECEVMMFRIMFNTAFIRSNILMLNRDEIDILWDAKDRFSRNFRAEVLLSEMDASNSVITVELPPIDNKDGLPVEAFAKVQEIFSHMDWLDTNGDATLHFLQQLTSSNVSKEKQDILSSQKASADFLSQKSNPDTHNEHLEKNATSDIISKSSRSLPTWQSICTLNQPSVVSARSENTQIRDAHAVLPGPTQPKIVSKSTLSSNSSPVSSTNSLQSSPTHVSRYHSVPSSPGKLGITALLHDHSSLGGSEVAYSTAISLSVASHFPGSSSDLSPETKIISPMAPPSSPHPPPPPPSPLCQPCFSVGTSLLTSSTLSESPAFPSSKWPYGNGVTSKTAISLSDLTTKNPSPLTTTKPLSSPLQPKSVPPPAPPPPPPLSVPLRNSPLSSSSSKKFPGVAYANSPVPSNCNFLSLSGTVSSPVNYKASSQVKDKDFSLVAGRASSPIMGLSISVPSTPPLPTYLVRPSLSLTLDHNTSIPPPPPLLPPHHPSANVPPNAPLPLPHPSLSLSNSYQHSLLIKKTNVPPPPPPPPHPCYLPMSSATSLIPQRAKKSSISSIPLGAPSAFSPNNPQNSSISSVPSVPPPLLFPNNTQNCRVSNTAVVPLPPLPPHTSTQNPSISSIHAVPPPPCPLKGLDSASGPPPPPSGSKGPLGCFRGRSLSRSASNKHMQPSGKRTLKPLHWVKVTRAMQGSLWDETQKFDEASKAPEFDMSELESLFSAAVPNAERGSGDKSSGRSSLGQKSDRVQLIDLRRANNCEIMLTKVKIPLTDLLSSVLALDDSVLDVDQVDNLIKFCPTKEEMDLLKNFHGDKESLGKCEQYILELMKVPRVESKLRVFSFKIQFHSQVSELSQNLNIVNSAAQEIRNSIRLKRIMQTILSLGNALNQGTARGSAIGFRLDSLLKLTETRSRNNKMTLMHYLCKVLGEKLPELLSFPKDLVSLEVSSKIQLRTLAEEMQAISKGLEKVEQELTASENDGPVSDTFCKTLKEFLVGAEAEVRALTSLYSNVGRNADALARYFGEDPARCPFEQVISTLLNFVRLFIKAHEENCKLLELEKKKQQKEAAESEKKLNAAKKEMEYTPSPSIKAKQKKKLSL